MQNQTISTYLIKGWVRSLLILLPYLIVAGIFQMLGFLVLGLDPRNFQLLKTPLQELIISLFTLFGTVVVIYLFRRSVDNESFRSLGFCSKGILKELIIGLSLGAIIITTGFIIMLLMDEIQWSGTNPDLANFMVGFLLFLSIAICEELLFRGYILNNLMISMPWMFALSISSLFFSLLHCFNPDFTWFSFWNLTLAGLLLGLPYIF